MAYGPSKDEAIAAAEALALGVIAMSEDEILGDYPYLEKADFPAVYAWAAQSGSERIVP